MTQMPATSGAGPLAAALVAEAGRKAGVLWVSVDGGPALLAWFCWHDGAAYVLHGGGEQHLPGLAAASSARVTLPSADTGEQLISWDAVATVVAPGSEAWQAVLPALIRARLNAADTAGAPQRWAADSVLTRLEASSGDAVVEAPGSLSDGSGAAPSRRARP